MLSSFFARTINLSTYQLVYCQHVRDMWYLRIVIFMWGGGNSRDKGKSKRKVLFSPVVVLSRVGIIIPKWVGMPRIFFGVCLDLLAFTLVSDAAGMNVVYLKTRYHQWQWGVRDGDGWESWWCVWFFIHSREMYLTWLRLVVNWPQLGGQQECIVWDGQQCGKRGKTISVGVDKVAYEEGLWNHQPGWVEQ